MSRAAAALKTYNVIWMEHFNVEGGRTDMLTIWAILIEAQIEEKLIAKPTFEGGGETSQEDDPNLVFL